MSDLWANGMWQGFVPPAHLYRRRRFVTVALEPPDTNGGSWIGAGKAVFDAESSRFLLSARPRTAADGVRGYAAQIHRSADGEEYELVCEVTKEQVARQLGSPIHSIEGTQLLRDPARGGWHLYISADTGKEFVWGGVQWETVLMRADRLEGEWECAGTVLSNGPDFDSAQARDATIDIIDGLWVCVYKAKDSERNERPALATSTDGLTWEKHGPLSVDGQDMVAFLSGSLFAGAGGIMFLGLETNLEDSREKRPDVVYADGHGIGHGGGPPPRFVARLLDLRALDLRTVFKAVWTPLSPFEHPEHPVLGYSSLVLDEKRSRLLMYVEAIDPELSTAIGLNTTVERLLVYSLDL